MRCKVRLYHLSLVLCLVYAQSVNVAGQDSPATDQIESSASPRFAGPTDDGFLLPNGWHLTPAGSHLQTTDMLLNILPLADNKRALITCSGFNEHFIGLVELEQPKLLAKQPVYQGWFGLDASSDQDTVYWSGGGEGRTHRFTLSAQSIEWAGEKSPLPEKLSLAEVEKLRRNYTSDNFHSGLCLDETRKILFSLKINAGLLEALPISGGQPAALEIGGRPYDIQLDQAKRLLYISDWAGSRVIVVEPASLRVIDTIPVGEHPNQIAVHPTDNRIFVACASSNSVSVIDTKKGVVTETIYTSLFPNSPEGSTPDALAVSNNGNHLFVANADNNCVAMIDVSVPNKSQVKGFIPTGWYPTAVAVTPDSKRLLIGIGKGNQSRPNPIYGDDLDESKLTDVERIIRTLMPYPYIGTIMSGSLSVVDIPSDQELKDYTEQVYKNCPYSGKLLAVESPAEGNPIPSRVGDPSPIKYVIYVIKENRTYDQVFGDLADGPNPKGNGDPTLCMFPRRVTPNHHKLAEEFVLLDNFYCNGQVSRDGHPWSTMAYNTDYVARDWHLTYSQRLGVDDDENEELSNAPSGYIWDACLRAGIDYRSYREKTKRITDADGTVRMEGATPSLIGHVSPSFGLGTGEGRPRDKDEIQKFIAEYDQFLVEQNMPRFIVLSLGEDHTDGTTPGAFTPEACVASNDLALGILVEKISHGPLWKETAIFVIEDDAQNGPDHVDAHRTVALAISPFTKRGAIDSTFYSTVSMIRTIELILGLEPLSQYDAAARPMFEAFTPTPNLSPYTSLPAEIDLNAKNDASAYGAIRSSKMDFSEYDRIDDFELNEILWRSIKGADAPLPPAVRRAIAFRNYGD